MLAGLTSLEGLGLGNNSISDISALSSLTSLTGLSIASNNISDISVLAGLTNLTGLTIGYNSISDISALSSLTSLENLYLWNNSISDISALSSLTSLTWLGLDGNSISNIAPLVANTGLGSGDYVYLWDNPLSITSINRHIPTLQDRGVTVYFSSSKPAVEEKWRRMPHVVMNRLKGGAREHRDGLFEQGSERAYLYRRTKDESVRLEWNPPADDEARQKLLMNRLKGVTWEHRDDLLEWEEKRAYLYKKMKDEVERQSR